jgi:hypothetical protein
MQRKQVKMIVFPGTGNQPKEMILSDVKLGQGQFGVVYVGYAKHAPW